MHIKIMNCTKRVHACMRVYLGVYTYKHGIAIGVLGVSLSAYQ